MTWRAHGADRHFDRQTVFAYADGAGELYNAYDFQSLLVREYRKETAPAIVLEVYRMASSPDAYGVFSFDPEGEQVDIGVRAIYGAGLLTFWKGKVFTKVLADPETGDTRQAVLTLGGQVAEQIPGRSRRPALLSVLPTDGLVENAAHYFHEQICLNHQYYISDANILNLSKRTRAVTATYDVAGDRARLLVISYPDGDTAKQAHERFLSAYLGCRPRAGSASMVRPVEDARFVGVRLSAKLLALVFEAKRANTCGCLLTNIAGNRRR